MIYDCLSFQVFIVNNHKCLMVEAVCCVLVFVYLIMLSVVGTGTSGAKTIIRSQCIDPSILVYVTQLNMVSCITFSSK